MAIASTGDIKLFLSLCILHLDHAVFKECSVREGSSCSRRDRGRVLTVLAHVPVQDYLVSALSETLPSFICVPVQVWRFIGLNPTAKSIPNCKPYISVWKCLV